MTQPLSASPVARTRRRSIWAAFALVAALVATGAALPASADVVGTGPGTISGTVTLPDGLPAQGIWVNASISFGQSTTWGASTTTDASGSYEFAGLDVNQYYVQVTAWGYQQPAGQNATLTDQAPTANMNFELLPFEVGVGTISGHVTGDGVPLADVWVGAYNQATSQNVNVLSDASGYYEFTGLSNGNWNVNASGDSSYQYLPSLWVSLTDQSPNATLDHAFVSWPTGTSAIGGVVTDPQTGAAIAGAHISLHGIDVAQSSFRDSDASGAYNFDLLPAGSYHLNLWLGGYLTASRDVQVLADTSLTADFGLIAVNATISGHLQTAAGNPVAGIYVSANTADGNWGWAETDANGDYVITDLGATSYTLTVGGPGTPYQAQERAVTPVANGDVVANFTLKDRKTGTFSGVPLLSNGEWYQKPVCVTLYSSKKEKPIADVVTIDPNFGDGSYYFPDVKPGSYTVKFVDCDDDPALKFDAVFLGGAKSYADATFVTIAAAQDSFENYITLKFRTANSTIAGHVAKPNGTPIAGLTVVASNGIVSASAVTDTAGNYTIPGLFNGAYTLSVGGAGTLYAQKHKLVTAIEDGTVTASFVLATR